MQYYFSMSFSPFWIIIAVSWLTFLQNASTSQLSIHRRATRITADRDDLERLYLGISFKVVSRDENNPKSLGMRPQGSLNIGCLISSLILSLPPYKWNPSHGRNGGKKEIVNLCCRFVTREQGSGKSYIILAVTLSHFDQ